MKLTADQIKFIKTRRAELDKMELEIRRLPDKVLYSKDEYVQQLFEISDERRFLNYISGLHNLSTQGKVSAEV